MDATVLSGLLSGLWAGFWPAPDPVYVEPEPRASAR